MTQREFEVLLREAILRDATEDCVALPSEEELHAAFLDTSALDAKTEPQLRERPPTARPKARPWYRQFGRMVPMLFLSFGLLLSSMMTNAEAKDFVKRILFAAFSDHNA